MFLVRYLRSLPSRLVLGTHQWGRYLTHVFRCPGYFCTGRNADWIPYLVLGNAYNISQRRKTLPIQHRFRASVARLRCSTPLVLFRFCPTAVAPTFRQSGPRNGLVPLCQRATQPPAPRRRGRFPGRPPVLAAGVPGRAPAAPCPPSPLNCLPAPVSAANRAIGWHGQRAQCTYFAAARPLTGSLAAASKHSAPPAGRFRYHTSSTHAIGIKQHISAAIFVLYY